MTRPLQGAGIDTGPTSLMEGWLSVRHVRNGSSGQRTRENLGDVDFGCPLWEAANARDAAARRFNDPIPDVKLSAESNRTVPDHLGEVVRQVVRRRQSYGGTERHLGLGGAIVQPQDRATRSRVPIEDPRQLL